MWLSGVELGTGDVSRPEKGVVVTATGWFGADIEPRSDLRDDASVLLLAAELASCVRRFVNITADDGTLLRARQALAAWDVLVGSPDIPGDPTHDQLDGCLGVVADWCDFLEIGDLEESSERGAHRHRHRQRLVPLAEVPGQIEEDSDPGTVRVRNVGDVDHQPIDLVGRERQQFLA